MEIRKTATISLLLLLALSCDRQLDLAHKYDNTESSKPRQEVGPSEDDPQEEQEDETVYTQINDFVKIGPVTDLELPVNMYFKNYWPDGKIQPLKKGDRWQMFWCEAEDVLTENLTPWPEDHMSQVTKSNVVFGKGYTSIENFNENGSWFIGVHPVDDSGHYVGFFHAESHWNNDGTAHKSIGVAYSDDYGKTWRDAAPIITDKYPKPESPEWSGLGDGCVVWNDELGGYVCYYQGRVWTSETSYYNTLCMAFSSDKKGSRGSWYKWDGNDFTLPAYDPATGCGGENVAIPQLSRVPGANPSVMWNTFLEKWVMVYASWTKHIYISISEDGLVWTKPERIVGSSDEPAWYPNLISEQGDLVGGEKVYIYFSDKQDSYGRREIGKAKMIFTK